ncbi:hypothetical protein Q1695_003721 [Nippostrongylus brasiliensis]|nr:hypothetical protein Q1695_003721 [Nippostrongylus brasiliensis]
MWALSGRWGVNGAEQQYRVDFSLVVIIIFIMLKEAYRRFFPVGAAMIVPYIAPMFSAVVKDATEVERQKVIEKTECLLDDMFECYERNVKLKGETG